MAVSLSVAAWNSSLPIAYRLHLPEEWAKDSERRKTTAFILHRCGLDPASASAPFVATFVDVTELFILRGTLL